MIKGLFTALILFIIFIAGMRYAITYPKLSKEIVTTLPDCNYNPGQAHK